MLSSYMYFISICSPLGSETHSASKQLSTRYSIRATTYIQDATPLKPAENTLVYVTKADPVAPPPDSNRSVVPCCLGLYLYTFARYVDHPRRKLQDRLAFMLVPDDQHIYVPNHPVMV